VIALRVETFGGPKNVSRAIFDTIPASLAPVFYDMNLSPGNHYFFGIQGNTPELHA
jgi:hypothetical protein